ncbi:MAG: type II secretion system F family protein [Rhodospirillales bacterium]|nr:type II secretion system F family protein [Rhodospirillales bacterium]
MTYELMVIFAGVLLAILAVGFAIGGALSPGASVRKRAIRLSSGDAGRTSAGAAVAVGGGSILRSEVQGIRMLEGLAKRLLPRQSMLTGRLRRTGLDITLGTYLLCSVGIGAVVFGAGVLFAGISALTASLIAVFVGLGLPHMIVGHLIARRRKKFLSVFPEAIELIVRGLKSGLPVSEAMAAVSREIADPVGVEFRAIMDTVKFGGKLEEVLWQTAKRLDIAELNFFVISLSIQQETGGNLAETLGNLADILRRRRQMKLKIKAMSGEARASACILGSLPFIMFAIVNVVNPGYASDLFTDPRGLVMVGAGLLSMLIGVAVMIKMIRFEI